MGRGKNQHPAINNERVLYAGRARALPLAFLFTILLARRHLCLYASECVCTACKCIDLCVSALCMQQRNILLSSIITIVMFAARYSIRATIQQVWVQTCYTSAHIYFVTPPSMAYRCSEQIWTRFPHRVEL